MRNRTFVQLIPDPLIYIPIISFFVRGIKLLKNTLKDSRAHYWTENSCKINFIWLYNVREYFWQLHITEIICLLCSMVVHHHTLKIVFKFISDKLKHLINDIRDELEKTKIKNVELISSLNEERKLSEDLKSGLESLHGVNEQIAEQEQLITGKCLVDF